MNTDQLKLLAQRLRENLSWVDLALSHGQTLDLIAALPGLRNWPEVIAFPDRLAARDYDLEAMSRLARRISSRLGPRMTELAARRLDADGLMNMLMPWRLSEPRDPSRRERLIICSGDSAGGSLLASRIADRVERIADRLVWGPVPLNANDPETFRTQHLLAWDANPDTSDQPQPWEREDDTHGSGQLQEWMAQLPVIAEYTRLEMWMDLMRTGNYSSFTCSIGLGGNQHSPAACSLRRSSTKWGKLHLTNTASGRQAFFRRASARSL